MVMASRFTLARPWMRRLVLSMVVTSVAGLAVPAMAQAQDARMVQRLDRLERDLSTLQRQVYRGEAPASQTGVAQPGTEASAQALPGDVAGRLQVRIAELERLVTELTGRIEETQYETRRQSQRLDQLVADVDFRLGRLEQATGLTAMGAVGPDGQPLPEGAGAPSEAMPLAGGAPEAQGQAPATAPTGPGILGYMRPDGTAVPAPSTAPSAEGAPPAGLLRPQDGAPADGPSASLPAGATAEEQYRHAFNLLRKGDFAAAEQALRAFLEAHPEHELAGNAQYWLGESYYVRGDMQNAAVAFLDGYQTYPKSGKGPDNLLKLGMAMGQLGQTQQACAALQKLGLEYPQASDAIKRRSVAERQKLGCP